MAALAVSLLVVAAADLTANLIRARLLARAVLGPRALSE
jgi:hypothetical protein